MLNHPTLHKLQELKLHGMAREFEEQLQSGKADDLEFEERLGLLVDRESTQREDLRLTSRLRKAKLRLQASIEDIDFKSSPRGLDRSLIRSLSSCDWVKKNRNILITGATGVGKTYLACALAQKACREGFRSRYFRTSRLFEELGISRGDGRHPRFMDHISRFDLLIIDDWGIQGFSDSQRTDLLEILEDRHGLSSTIVTSQFPVNDWHKAIGNPTLADAILDRLIHNAHVINLKGGSMRKRRRMD